MTTAHVVGLNDVIAKITTLEGSVLGRVAEAVESSAVDVANHAKANHERGLAHTQGRFETRTGALVGSIMPDLTEVSKTAVEAQVVATMDYGPNVEFGTSRSRAYPFMGPAMTENAQRFRERVAKAARPGP
jgi:HK97 gp10 family phage protein